MAHRFLYTVLSIVFGLPDGNVFGLLKPSHGVAGRFPLLGCYRRRSLVVVFTRIFWMRK